MPEIMVPIVPGVVATAGLSFYGSLGLSANISMAKMQDYWNISGGIGLKAAAGVKGELGIGINVVVASATAKVGLDIGIRAEGNASLSGGIRYNPTTKSVEMATPLKFMYDLKAMLAAKVYAKLEWEALWGVFGGEKVVDLAEWELGRLDLSGQSEASDFSGLWANLKNKAKLTSPLVGTLYES